MPSPRCITDGEWGWLSAHLRRCADCRKKVIDFIVSIVRDNEDEIWDACPVYIPCDDDPIYEPWCYNTDCPRTSCGWHPNHDCEGP